MKFFFIEGNDKYKEPIEFIFKNEKVFDTKINFVNNFFNKTKFENQVFNPAEADIIVCVGGDGTLLDTIKEYKTYNKPFLGFGGGTANFLMNDINDLYLFEEKDLDLRISTIFNNQKIRNIQFNCIKATIDGKEYQGFNEICIGGDMNSWIEFHIEDTKDEFFIEPFFSGGIIISTAQGSTGINKNNYGAVMPLNFVNNWSLTSDKGEFNKRVNKNIENNKLNINFFSRTPVKAWIDGQANIVEIKKPEIIVEKGESVEVIFTNYDSLIKRR